MVKTQQPLQERCSESALHGITFTQMEGGQSYDMIIPKAGERTQDEPQSYKSNSPDIVPSQNQ